MIQVKAILTIDGTDFVLDNTKLNTISWVRRCSKDSKMPVTGIISSTGKIQIIDKDETLKGYAEAGTLTSALPFKIYVDDVQEADMIAYNWSYDFDGKIVKASLQDDLVNMQKRKFSQLYDEKETETAKTLLDKLVAESSGYSFDISSTINSYLETITIGYNGINEDTLWNTWNKLCTIARLQVYKAKNGNVKVIKAL